MRCLRKTATHSKAADPVRDLSSPPIAWEWIRPLAAPYLCGYRAVPEKRGSLRGYWFLHPDSHGPPSAATGTAQSPPGAGFFVGYLVSPAQFEYFTPLAPECLAFVFLAPLQGPLERRLVQEKDSLVRKTFDYIRLLTHRPPRFVFHEAELAAMTRHQSMREWPPEKYQHFSRNFFIETLAWLVRSALVRRLLAEHFPAGERNRKPGRRQPKMDAKKRPRKRADLN
jgi:hypothetical protein